MRIWELLGMSLETPVDISTWRAYGRGLTRVGQLKVGAMPLQRAGREAVMDLLQISQNYFDVREMKLFIPDRPAGRMVASEAWICCLIITTFNRETQQTIVLGLHLHR